MKKKGIENLISNVGCKKMTVRPNGFMRLCTDGEITTAGKTTFEIVHNGFNFVVPRKNAVLLNT